MGYLIKNDYKSYIQGDYLRQLVQGDDSKRVIEENTSLQVIVQRLTAKYDLDLEFTDMQPYDSTKVYGAAQRTVVDFSPNGFAPWAAGVHAEGDLVIEAGTGYICNADITDTVFDATQWTSVGAQYTIYYGAYPATCTVNGQLNPATLTQPYAPVFNYKTLYSKGDVIFWKGYTYTANQASTVLCHNAVLQYSEYNNIPYNNIFPDDPINNANGAYWNNKEAYTIPVATPLTDAKWVQGDNRNQTIKDAMVRITVFKLSPLIAPKNRPDVWLDDYRSILRELKDVAEGMITMILPVKQPQNNTRTWYCGAIKQTNNY